MQKVTLASYDTCTGCGACASVCTKGAILLDYDKNGYLRPTIDRNSCVLCGLCSKKCPVLQGNRIKRTNPTTYRCFTAWTLDDCLSRKCASGGVSTQLMIDFLGKENSIVYGAAMSDYNTCAHVSATTIEELEPIIGTKYIQSDASWAMRDAKQKLNEGWRVLFSGTPCQIAALKLVAGDRFSDRLITIELICHGAPSKHVTDVVTDYYHSHHLIGYSDKKVGWFVNGKKSKGVLTLVGEDGQVKKEGPGTVFSKIYSLYMNPSCFKCSYARPERVSDIIIGDQWGLARNLPQRSKLGASSVIIASQKGLDLFFASDNLYRKEDSMSTINAPNIFMPTYSPLNPWLSKRVHLCNKIPKHWRYNVMSLNWRKFWISLPLLVYARIMTKIHSKSATKIIDYNRNKYNWK